MLDFCSSWISHYPERIEQSVKQGEVTVIGMGMNEAELVFLSEPFSFCLYSDSVCMLARNPILSKTIIQDLNDNPEIPVDVYGESEKDLTMLDASTCVVSIDYLVRPVEVLSSLRQRTRVGGTVHLAVSNRCFPTKVSESPSPPSFNSDECTRQFHVGSRRVRRSVW